MCCKDGVWTEELGSEFIPFTQVGGIGIVNWEGDVLELFVARRYLRVREWRLSTRYRFTNIADDITAKFTTKDLIDIRAMGFIRRIRVWSSNFLSSGRNECSSTCPLHGRTYCVICSRNSGDFALEALEKEPQELLGVLLCVGFKVSEFPGECIIEFAWIEGLVVLRAVDFTHEAHKGGCELAFWRGDARGGREDIVQGLTCSKHLQRACAHAISCARAIKGWNTVHETSVAEVDQSGGNDSDGGPSAPLDRHRFLVFHAHFQLKGHESRSVAVLSVP